MKLVSLLFKLFLIAAFLAAIGFALAMVDMNTPSVTIEQTRVIIPKGMRSRAVAHELAKANLVRYPDLFYVIQGISGNARKFKAGEYMFEAGASPAYIARKLINGEVVVHKITIPEGWNMREIKAALNNEPVLEGEITIEMKEGTLLPETYYFTYGDLRNTMVSRMQLAMTRALDEAWNTRAEGLPLASKEEALTLASIVEKETGVPEERTRVAAVFINRLKKGMRLQTDPTVIYGIEQQTGQPLGRPLNYADLAAPTPYNTYVIPGLPPTPIANPSIESIEATLHPAQTDELYFVATGNGGHNFARTVEEHNKNVAAYRAAVKAAQ